MKILKFGGTSVGSVDRIKRLSQLISTPGKKIVVLSAMSGTTNQLLEFSKLLRRGELTKARSLLHELDLSYQQVIQDLLDSDEAKEAQVFADGVFRLLRSFLADGQSVQDKEERVIVAQGELLSTHLLHFYLQSSGIQSVLLPALDFIRIDENREPDFKEIESRLASLLASHSGTELFITQGYICRNHAGAIDNLRRGGSDYSATIIGAALHADEIQIWTDIDGMHNNDPRIVKGTFPIAELSFEEAAELAYFGAKILHPTCVQPAKARNIPVRLLNTMQPEAQGTLISESSSTEIIKAVAAKDEITAIKIKSARMLQSYGFLQEVFSIFKKYKTPIDVITTSEVAVSLTIDNIENLAAIESELSQFCEVNIDSDLSIICIVGDFSAEQQGYANKIFEALKEIPIRMISYGGSVHNVTIVVNTEHKAQALISLNEHLFSAKK